MLPRSVVVSLLCYHIWVVSTASDTGIEQDLSPKLSSGARILTENDVDFAIANARWDEATSPEFSSVIEVATEDDIVNVVLYANAKKLPFLPVAGAHGSIDSLKTLKHGIHISTKRMNGVKPHGDIAIIQAGASTLDVISKLWDVGKQAVSGIAECTAYMGITLGGGHSALQGRYGLAADNLVEARVVLANGTVVTASEETNKDLFWGLRGAGHNFGIVSEVKAKIYNVDKSSTWYTESSVFFAHQFGGFIDAVFDLSDHQPSRLLYAGAIARVHALDPVNPVIILTLLYDGPAADLEPHVQGFRNLKPVHLQNGTVPYRNLASQINQALDQDVCRKDGRSRLRFPAYLTQHVNLASMQDVFDFYAQTTAAEPGLNGSVVLIEVAARQAVKSVPLESTAVPVRDHGVILLPLIEYYERDLDDKARELGEGLRKRALKVTGKDELQAYVNYASGSEKIGEIYGHESWRIEKLRDLKRRYDTENKFRYYAPIGTENPEIRDEL